jgi:hypothetical protein
MSTTAKLIAERSSMTDLEHSAADWASCLSFARRSVRLREWPVLYEGTDGGLFVSPAQ